MTDNNVEVKFGADTSDYDAKTKGMYATTQDLHKSLHDTMLDYDKSMQQSLATSSESMNKLNFATAGTTREFLVLGREVLTGNFSRIPGSLIVLANRMGGLQTILEGVTVAMVGWTAAIGVTIGVLYEWVTAVNAVGDAQETIRGAMELNNQSLSYSDQAVNDNIDRLILLAHVSADTAEKISVDFARAGDLSVDLKNKLINMVGDYAAATGKDAPKAAADLIKMFSEPQKGAHALAEEFKGVLTPAQLDQIDKMKEMGASAQEMADVLLNDVGDKLDNFRDKHLSTLTRAWQGLIDTIHLSTSGTNSALDVLLDPRKLPKPQDNPAAQEQNHQNELNAQEAAGLEILKGIHGENEKINELELKRAGLVKAVNAAMENSNDLQANELQSGIKNIDDQILKAKKSMNAAAVAAEKQASADKMAIANNDRATTLKLDQLDLEQKKNFLTQDVQMGLITEQQKFVYLEKFQNEEYALNREAIEDQINTDGLKLKERNKLQNDLLVLEKKHQVDISKVQQQAQAAEIQKYHQVFATIDSSFKSMIAGVLQGTQTWKQALANMFTNLLTSFAGLLEEMASRWIENQIMMALFGETEAASIISGHAAEGAAAAYASTAAIPIVGPALAPGAAALAYGEIMAFNVASFDVGTDFVPKDMLANIHEGERVMTRGENETFTKALRMMSGNGDNGSSSSGGGSGGDMHMHFHGTVIDGKNWFMNNKSNIAASLKAAARGGDRHVAALMKQ